MLTRRRFLEGSAWAGCALQARGQTMAGLVLSPASLTPFVDALPRPPIAQPIGRVPSHGKSSVPVAHYRVAMKAFQAKVHRDLAPTTFWGYSGSSPGPTFETTSGEGLLVDWVNELPAKHFLPIDHTLHGAERENPEVRTSVHVHGARVGPESDGYPENWIVPGQSARHFYPNRQAAATLFYHDHAMGITRLNMVAGLFGLFLIRDEAERALELPAGDYEVPLIVCDRLFTPDGQLSYPTSGNPHAPWTSEFYGNAILVNGKLFPFLQVEPRRYRFRMVNTSNAGFYNFSFSRDNKNLVPGREPFWQIGSDQGLLSAPLVMKSLSMTPGERADLVVDFAPWAGQSLYLKQGPEPFLQFRVAAAKAEDESRVPGALRPIVRMAESAAEKRRELTLADYKDALGKPRLMLLNGAHWSMPVTETPVLGSTEIWTFINLTDDTHPIHLHLVRFQILDRRRFDFEVYKRSGKLVFTGPVVLPEPNEMGWKDTVRADVLMATRIIVKFDGFVGRYVWHCHVLEHEDNEMMRPYEVVRRT